LEIPLRDAAWIVFTGKQYIATQEKASRLEHLRVLVYTILLGHIPA